MTSFLGPLRGYTSGVSHGGLGNSNFGFGDCVSIGEEYSNSSVEGDLGRLEFSFSTLHALVLLGLRLTGISTLSRNFGFLVSWVLYRRVTSVSCGSEAFAWRRSSQSLRLLDILSSVLLLLSVTGSLGSFASHILFCLQRHDVNILKGGFAIFNILHVF